MKQSFDFRHEWKLISNAPCPTKKLCRQTVRTISQLRQQYRIVLGYVALHIIGNDLLDSEDQNPLLYIRAKIASLVFVAEVLRDAHELQPHPLRHRRKLFVILEKLKEDLAAVDAMIEDERHDLSIFWDPDAGDGFIAFSDISRILKDPCAYFQWQRN